MSTDDRDPPSTATMLQTALVSTQFLSPERQHWSALAKDSPQEIEILAEQVAITGYQLYMVEQWTPNRKHLNKSIVVYTGDKTHSIKCTLIRVVSKQADFQSHIAEEKTRPMDVELGYLNKPESKKAKVYVTNLGSFPSHFNIILVPDGDFDANHTKFVLNLNMKRFSCSGRSALTLAAPSDAQIERFHQIYKTNSSLTFEETVLQLVRLAQAALCLIGYLAEGQIDGLLCDDTSTALQEYNATFGPFEAEIKGSMADSVLLAELLSKVVSVRNKLHAMGDPCPKNPFVDRETFINAVATFQKAHKLEPSGFLTAATVSAIEGAYAKESQQVKMHKVLKSRIDDMSGNHALVSVETADLDQLAKTVNIDTFRVLWGKKSRSAGVDVLLESATIAEGLIQGGRELGRNILKKAPRVPEKYFDGGSTMIKGIRTGVAESFSKIEGFVDRTLVSRLQRISPTKSHAAGETVDEHGADSADGANFGDEQRSESNASPAIPSDAEILKLVGRMGAARFTANRQRATSTETLELEPIYPEATPDHIRRRAITDPAEFCYDSDFEQLKDRVVQLKERETTYAEMVLKLKVLANNFEQAIQHLSDIYMESWQEFSGLEKLLNDLIEEYRLVQAKIEALQTMSSKLQYDVDALDEKMRETDEIVDHFFHKIKAVEEQMATLQNLNGPRVIAPATVDARR